MHTHDLALARSLRFKPLAVWLALAFAHAHGAFASAALPAHPATTRPVTNCEDDGSAGSLRAVIEAAADGDTIDLQALACSTITLTSGAIVIPLDNLALTGPGTSLTIDGNGADSLFEHTGSGTLTIDDLTLAHGFKYQNGSEDADGGCIFSAGSVSLTGTAITGCVAEHGGDVDNFGAIGGAIYAEGDVTMIGSTVTHSEARSGDSMHSTPGFALAGGINAGGRLTLIFSTLSNNLATTTSTGASSCGGAFAHGGFDAKYSTIADNTASSYETGESDHGAVFAGGEVQIRGSTISGNTAAEDAGFAFVGGTATIANSTISGNHASIGYGGLTAAAPLTLSNSTIAFNEAAGSVGGGGLVVLNGQPLELESTIIANNTSVGGFAADLDSRHVIIAVTGADNLVGAVGSNVDLPAGTMRSDPLLGPLLDNGGATRTHAPLAGSPAIDAGNDTADLDTDQRGSGFARVVGAVADIGAFETNPDVVFVNGFN